jgi:hypothetical protein
MAGLANNKNVVAAGAKPADVPIKIPSIADAKPADVPTKKLSVAEANRKIADATSAAFNAISNAVKGIIKGTTASPATSIKEAYDKAQNIISTTLADAQKYDIPLKDREIVKENITGAINSIKNFITEKSSELESKLPTLPPTVLSAIAETTKLTKDKFSKMATKLKPPAVTPQYSDISTSIYSELVGLFNSGNMVSKLTFLLLILFFFILLLRIGTTIIAWAFSHSPSPILLNGMINSKQMFQIPQNPASSGAIPILRSVNEDDGIGFTWSVWINIDDFTYKEKDYKHVFHKGNDNINVSTSPFGMNFPNNSPGLYIAPDKNDLVVVMNTFDSITEEIKIKDIPLNKWVNVIIRINEQKQMDVYINGRLSRRHILPSIPKQNYGDVYVSMNGGFSGNTSLLRYYAFPIGTNEIQSIVDAGPNTSMISVGGESSGSAMDYLSTKWFFQTNV